MAWLKLAGQLVLMFDPIGTERTLVYGAMSLGHVLITDNSDPYVAVVHYLMSAKKYVVLQAMYKSAVFKDSD